MTVAGADIIVCHLGLTTGGKIGARTALTLDDCVERITDWTAAARSVRDDVIVLCHGGPISEPPDAQYVLERVPGLNGFYGASSMERLPVESSVADRAREFLSLDLSRTSAGSSIEARPEVAVLASSGKREP